MPLNVGAGLVVHLRINEGTGTTLVNSVTPGTHDATLAGAPTWVAGRLGGGLDFNPGTSDRAVVPDHANLTPAAVSVFAWAKFDAWSASLATFMSKYNPGSPFAGFSARRNAGGSLEIFVFVDGTGTVSTAFSDTTKLHHVGFTYGGAADSIVRGYLDGVQFSTNASPTTNFVNTTSDLWLGGDVASPTGRYADCKIYDFRLYSVALSAPQIRALSRMIPCVAVGPAGRRLVGTGERVRRAA